MLDSAEQLGSTGALARHIENFAPRQAQQEMALAVEQAIDDNHVLVTEAGTGTGKTFAYLVPALISGKKIVISTGTKTLQDQLFHRDIPTVREALNISVSIALLKGRANYLCLHRLELAGEKSRFKKPALRAQWQQVRDWQVQTNSGDIAECSVLSEDAMIWPAVTANADNCLGQDCPSYSDCFMFKARKRAQQADIVVVNHHLLLADMALRDDGVGEVLPAANAFIIDEAHQLPEAAAQFFGLRLSSRQLNELANDAIAEHLKHAKEHKMINTAAQDLQKATADLRLALGNSSQRGSWQALQKQDKLTDAIEELAEKISGLEDALEPTAERERGLEHCFKRAQAFSLLLPQLTGKPPEDSVQWFETYRRSFSFHLTPMEVSDTFDSHIKASSAAWIFSSATLAVGDNFAHFSNRMGLGEPETHRWDSPFDFAQQALMYIPTAMPEPNSYEYTQAVIEKALPVIEASTGGVFILFTSHRALQEAERLLDQRTDHPLFVQGSMPRSELLTKFREHGQGVLLGTASFWEGIDVRGEALTCVIIDKLPFASPDDPVLKARIDAMRKEGQNPFMTVQLPSAVLSLKQGAGRLIRDSDDYGVLMLCDPRLYSKSYGRLFLKSMPAMPITREQQDVNSFFQRNTEQPATTEGIEAQV